MRKGKILFIIYLIFTTGVVLFVFSKETFLKYPLLSNEIAKNHFLPSRCFSSSPFYIYINAFFLHLVNLTPLQLKYLQLVILWISVFLLYRMLNSFFKENLALIITGIFALYPPVIIYTFSLLPEVFILFFNILFFYFWNRKRYFLGGLCLGVSLILRPSIVIFAIFLLLYLLIKKWHKKIIISSLVGFFLPLLAVFILNYIAGNDRVLVTYSGGSVFYSSNNPYSRGLGYTPPFLLTYLENEFYLKKGSFPYEHYLFKRIACCLKEKELKYSQISNFWYEESFKFIFKNRLWFLKHLSKKLFYFLNGYEFYDTFSSYLNSLLLRKKIKILPSLYIIYPFSILGIIIYLKRKEKKHLFNILLLYLLSYLVVAVIFYVSARLRLPIILGLSIFAGISIKEITTSLFARRYKLFTIYIITLIFFVFLVSRQDTTIIYEKEINNPSFLFYNLGVTCLKNNYLSSGIKYLKKAYAINPQNIVVQQLLKGLGGEMPKSGNFFIGWREPQKEKLLKEALSLFYQQNFKKAEEIFLQLHKQFPSDKTILYNLAITYLKESRTREGIKLLEVIKKELKFSSISFEMFYFLGKGYYKQREYKKALKYLRKSLCLNPFFKPAKNLLKNIQSLTAKRSPASEKTMPVLNLQDR